MKRTLIAVLCTALFATSCKKDQENIQVPVSSTLILNRDAFGDQTLSTPVKNLNVASFTAVLTNMGTTFALSSMNLTFQGVSSALENFHIVIKSVDGSFADSCLVTKTGVFAKTMYLPGTATYKVEFFGDINRVVLGTLSVTANVQYIDNDNIRQSTTAIGHKTTFVRQSVPVIVDKAVPTTTIVNGKEMIVATTDISSPDGSTGIKQISYQFAFADNGALSPLAMGNPKFFVNDQDVTTQVTFIPDADYVIHVVFTAGIGESVIDSSMVKNYKLKFTPNGFGPATDGDGFSCTRLGDDAGSDEYQYVAKGTNGMATLSDSRSDAGTGYNFIWSPRTAAGHSMVFGLSTKDALSGKGVVKNSAPTIFVVK